MRQAVGHALRTIFDAARQRARPPCPGCGRTAPTRGICSDCATASGVTRSWKVQALTLRGSSRLSVYAYADYWLPGRERPTPVASALLAFKYKGDRAAGHALRSAIASLPWPESVPDGAMVPIPLHPRRMRSRGLNQAAWLARGLASSRGVPVSPDALRRQSDDPPQAGLSANRRRLRGEPMFRASSRRAHGHTVVLVDDVCTTGVTLQRAAAACAGVGLHVAAAMVLLRADGIASPPSAARVPRADEPR